MITPSFGLTATERVLPKLALDFTTASLDSRVTFTRTTGASNPATYVDSNGYIASATNDQPRFDYDPVTLACKGLLIEESRTNYALRSDNFSAWTQSNCTVGTDVVTSPSNVLNGDKIISDTSLATGHWAYLTFATAAGAANTVSIFAKAAEWNTLGVYMANTGRGRKFNLATGQLGGTIGSAPTTSIIEAYPNGWYRCTITYTASFASDVMRLYIGNNDVTSLDGDGVSGVYVWGAQLEQAAFATSYIPTTTAALTRNADVAVMTGTNFSDWFNASEGTCVLECDVLASTLSNKFGWSIYSSSTNRFHCFVNNGSDAGVRTLGVTSGVTQWDIRPGSPNVVANTPVTIAVGYKQNNVVGYRDTLYMGADTVCTVPSVDTLAFGANEASGSFLNGHVAKFNYYPQRCTNSEVQAFSK